MTIMRNMLRRQAMQQRANIGCLQKAKYNSCTWFTISRLIIKCRIL